MGLELSFRKNLQFETHFWCLSHLVPELQLFEKKSFFLSFRRSEAILAPFGIRKGTPYENNQFSVTWFLRYSSLKKISPLTFRRSQATLLPFVEGPPYENQALLTDLAIPQPNGKFFGHERWFLTYLTYIQEYTKIIKTRLTYNCAHLRSTKESLTIEYLRWKLYWIFWVKIFRVKTFWVKNFFG